MTQKRGNAPSRSGTQARRCHRRHAALRGRGLQAPPALGRLKYRAERLAACRQSSAGGPQVMILDGM